MATENPTPETLLEAVKYFSDKDFALQYFAGIRWPDGVKCPDCNEPNPSFLQTRRIWKCRACSRQFSAKVGTIFEDSPIGLDKWLPAMWLVTNCKNGISSYELARDLKVTQKTAWFMLHRLRLAMQENNGGGKLSGDVEVDETYIGGKARNMHPERRRRAGKQGTWFGKVAVMGLLERHPDGTSKVRTHVLRGTKRRELHRHIADHIERGSNVYSDALKSYGKLSRDFMHHFVDHAETYVEGAVHTNGCENYWSLLKRSISGTYVSVEPFHLFRYLDEQAFRFNQRKATDAERFKMALASVAGRRVTYTALTGKEASERR